MVGAQEDVLFQCGLSVGTGQHLPDVRWVRSPAESRLLFVSSGRRAGGPALRARWGRTSQLAPAGWGTSRLTFDPCWTCPPPAGAAWGAPPPTALPALGGRPGTLAKAHFRAKFWVYLGAYGGGRVHTVVLSRCGETLQGWWEQLARRGLHPPPKAALSAVCETPRPGPPWRAGAPGVGGASGR